ncbi:MAG: hypothetical protein K8I27_15585 [Planctomycetes bacterium]|nr:hypothetical protein [Planctomycetota bacterium]
MSTNEESASSQSQLAGAVAKSNPMRQWLRRWEGDEFRLAGPLSVGNGLLRAQGAVARDLLGSRGLNTYIAGCGIITVFASLLYGAILGSVNGAGQVLYAALKFPVVIVGSCAVCLPSFYVFQALTGARLTLQQALASVLMLGAAAGLILLGCAPIAWFFSVSTSDGATTFLGLMHAVIIALSTTFGFHFLARTHRYVAWKYGERLFDGRVLALWFVLLVMVGAQMAHFIGPLDSGRGLLETERGFFLAALLDT